MEHMQSLLLAWPWVPTMLASWRKTCRMSLYALVLGVVLKVTYLAHHKVPHEVTLREREERVRDPSLPHRSPLRLTTGSPNRIYPHASNRVPRRGRERPSPRTLLATLGPTTRPHHAALWPHHEAAPRRPLAHPRR